MPGQARLLEQCAPPWIAPLSSRQQRVRCALLQNLHDGGRTADLRFGQQQMHMFGHDHVSHHHKSVTLPRLLKDGEEAVSRWRRVQQGPAAVAGTRDKVQVMRAVSAMQAARRYSMVSAASYPPLQKSQGRGTRSFEMGKKKTTLKGWATRQIGARFRLRDAGCPSH